MTVFEEGLEKKSGRLPESPGVYQFLDNKEQVIYVGKAKNLRKRVSSYFSRDRQPGRIALLVSRIRDIQYIVVETEYEALLLENSLIKKYKPRYNVQLKDDKTYPWICIKNERFPRIFTTRNPVRDGSEYYGPYASVRMVHTLLDLIRQLYPLRTCKYDLSRENIEKGKFRVCLEYHIGNCKGPCEGLQEEEEYNGHIAAARSIIKGHIHKVIRRLKKLKEEYAAALDYEKAQVVKEKVVILEKYQSKSTVVSPRIHNVDVVGLVSDEQDAFINYMKVVNGAIVQAHTMEMSQKVEEEPQKLLEIAVAELRQRYESDAREIIVPFLPEMEIPGIHFHVPQRGDKKQLLELSQRNAKYYKLEKRKQEAQKDPEKHTSRILETLRKDLRMEELPVHIECFDNSNIQGREPVSACVVFRRAKPSKKEYRHFNIRSVEGPDDYASMKEAIRRRYSRLLKEGEELPQLIVIDGGKGQLSAAVEGLEELSLRGRISIIGIAKRLEEIYFPEDPVPLYLDKRSESLKLIQRLRDEAHRFGVGHHRKRRTKSGIGSELTNIEGIGEKSTQKLLRHFRSVKRVREASREELAKVVGPKMAGTILAHFHSDEH